jgi:hypothetical protein
MWGELASPTPPKVKGVPLRPDGVPLDGSRVLPGSPVLPRGGRFSSRPRGAPGLVWQASPEILYQREMIMTTCAPSCAP